MIYCFHIFDKTCEQVYVKHLHHQHPSAAATAAAARSTTMAGADHAKLLFGVVFSLYSLSQKLSDRHQKLSYATKDYRVDTLRTLSGLLFVVISSSSSNAGPGLPPGLLETVYANLYVPFVVCNPLGSTALYPADEVALLVPSLLSSSSSSGGMKEGEQDERETKKKEKRRRDLLERETAVGYGGRDHVRGVLMVQGNVLFDAALTQFLTGL